MMFEKIFPPGVSCDWAVFRGPEMGEIDPR